MDKTPELCYLTQIVFRLFEDPKKDISDPKRFRIEILFSPGATATPLHMAEMDRDLDNSRFETDPLELISKDGLSCQEIEDYFNNCIEEGKTDEDDDESVLCPPTSVEDKKKVQVQKDEQQQKQLRENQQAEAAAAAEKATVEISSKQPATMESTAVHSAEDGEEGGLKDRSLPDVVSDEIQEDDPDVKANGDMDDDATEATDATPVTRSRRDTQADESDSNEAEKKYIAKNVDDKRDADGHYIEEDERIERVARILEKKYFWASGESRNRRVRYHGKGGRTNQLGGTRNKTMRASWSRIELIRCLFYSSSCIL